MLRHGKALYRKVYRMYRVESLLVFRACLFFGVKVLHFHVFDAAMYLLVPYVKHERGKNIYDLRNDFYWVIGEALGVADSSRIVVRKLKRYFVEFYSEVFTKLCALVKN